MTSLSMTEARAELTELANTVMFGHERVCVKKNNKPAFALVPIEDVELLEALEDRVDLAEALIALKESGSTSLTSLKKELGL